MPNLHASVVYCPTCDHLIAESNTQPCEECRKLVCTECRKPTSDPDLHVCSRRCELAFEARGVLA